MFGFYPKLPYYEIGIISGKLLGLVFNEALELRKY